MKKLMIMVLSGALAISLVACTSSKPSIDEVKEAIANGTITVEDALEKCYITEDDFSTFEKSEPIQAENKLESNKIVGFDTTTLGGDTFSTGNLSPITYFAFLNPKAENAEEILNILSENYEDVKQSGGDILIITLDEENNELFTNSEIPVVHYSDSMKKALGNLSDMVIEDGFSGSWNVAGAFPMSWSMKIDAEEDFVATLNSLKEMLEDYTTTDGVIDGAANIG